MADWIRESSPSRKWYMYIRNRAFDENRGWFLCCHDASIRANLSFEGGIDSILSLLPRGFTFDIVNKSIVLERSGFEDYVERIK